VMGEVTAPPYRLRVDLGPENEEHVFQAIAHTASGSTGESSLKTPRIRVDEEVDVNLQQLYVTVTRGAAPVLDLQREDFVIIDEKERQTLVTFARGDIPFTAVVMVDASVSMQGAKLQAARRGAETFFTGMKELDEGKLLVFSDRILHATPFTTSPAVLVASLGQVSAKGGTALNDHLYLALKQLEARQGRRVVLLLSDGVDSHSVLQMQEVLAKARRSQALIYWLRLPYSGPTANGQTAAGSMPVLTTAWRSAEIYRREFEMLEQTVVESGGRIQTLQSVDGIEAAFSEILAELRAQYVLGYYPLDRRHAGTWRSVRVRVRDASLVVRSRNGYIDF
jgi:Ca-activated chloride channel homolog